MAAFLNFQLRHIQQYTFLWFFWLLQPNYLQKHQIFEFSAFWADFQENGSRLAQNGSQNPMGYVWKMYQKSDYTCRQAVLTVKPVSTHLLAFQRANKQVIRYLSQLIFLLISLKIKCCQMAYFPCYLMVWYIIHLMQILNLHVFQREEGYVVVRYLS